MGRFKEKLSEIAPFGPLIGAFTVGFTIASLIWLLLNFYPTHDKISESKNEISSLKQEIDKKQNQLSQKSNENTQLQNIINKKEGEIDRYKNSLGSKNNECDQLKIKLSKTETENKQLQHIKRDKPITIAPVIEPKEKIIEHNKLDTPLARIPEPIFESYQQQRRKTGFEIGVIEHHTTSVLDGAFFITLNKCGKGGVDAIIRAKGYPDLKIENGQAGQDLIFRSSKSYEIRIMSIGANSNSAGFFIKEIE